jgi:hypothetical protein
VIISVVLEIRVVVEEGVVVLVSVEVAVSVKVSFPAKGVEPEVVRQVPSDAGATQSTLQSSKSLSTGSSVKPGESPMFVLQISLLPVLILQHV